MGRVSGAEIERMRASLFIERSWHSLSSTRFWVLLVLAAVIAGAGVAGDSTATVIGAMIVAPLMTPILGCALALVLTDRPHLLRCILLVVSGAATVVVIGFLLGFITSHPDSFANDSQVVSRISPHLIDLLAALATGTVGAFALVRSDISDALPGVAIAISLVPPLAVTGLLINVHRYHDAWQAALLFTTNVAAIVATGVVVFLGYRVREAAQIAGLPVGRLRGRTLAVVGVLMVLVAVPLTTGTLSLARDARLDANATPVADRWARLGGWEVTGVQAQSGTVTVTVLGLLPAPAADSLRRQLDQAGMTGADLRIRLDVGMMRDCPPAGRCKLAAQDTP